MHALSSVSATATAKQHNTQVGDPYHCHEVCPEVVLCGRRTTHKAEMAQYLYASPQPCLSDYTIREDFKLLLGQVACYCLQACIHLPLSRVAPPVEVLLLPDVDELAVHDKCAAPLSLCEAGVVDLNHSQFLLDVLLYAGIANKGVR